MDNRRVYRTIRMAMNAGRGCKGFGEMLADVPIDHPGLQAIYTVCGDLGLPVLFHGDHWLCRDEPGAPRLEKMLQTFPKTVLFGTPRVSGPKLAPE